MDPQYQIRIQAILVHDDDGTGGATITTAQVKERIKQANSVYASAGVAFLFDEAIDLFHVNSTLLNREFTILDPPDIGGDKWSQIPRVAPESHDEAREQFARQFPGKLVIFFRTRVKFQMDKNGFWQLVGAGGVSSWASYSISLRMDGGDVIWMLPHEVGHYLQIRHVHVDAISTLQDAVNKIISYVDTNGHPASEGLDALDADLVWVTDTPADADDPIFSDQGMDPCGPTAQLPIPVTFADKSSQTYTLAPDRNNVMTYFATCPQSVFKVSPQQARRVRDGLELGMRHDLVSLEPRSDYNIVRGASVTGGPITEVAVALVRAGRVATAARRGDGNLEVVVWDIGPNGGQVKRRGEKAIGAIGKVALSSLGLGLLATAVTLGSGELKVIIWQVDEDGNVTRKGSASIAGKVNDVAACRVGIEHLATAVRREDGTMHVDTWHVSARGEIEQKGSETAGQIISPIAMNSIGTRGFVTYVRDGNADFKPILWQLNDKKVTPLGSINLNQPPVGGIAGCMLDRELAVGAVQDVNASLQLVAYYFPDDAQRMEQRGTAHAEKFNEYVAACRMGTELLVTGMRDGANNLKLILWDVSKDGRYIVRRDDRVDESFTRLAMCYAGGSLFVTATRGSGGILKVTAWLLQSPVSTKVNVGDLKKIFDSAPKPIVPARGARGRARLSVETLCDSESE